MAEAGNEWTRFRIEASGDADHEVGSVRLGTRFTASPSAALMMAPTLGMLEKTSFDSAPSEAQKGSEDSRRTEWLAGTDEATNYIYDIPRHATPQPAERVRKRDRDRAERIRLAGGPKPSLRDRAVALARERGEVRTKELTDIGVHRCYLSRMCDEGLLVKVGFGRYRAAEAKAA